MSHVEPPLSAAAAASPTENTYSARPSLFFAWTAATAAGSPTVGAMSVAVKTFSWSQRPSPADGRRWVYNHRSKASVVVSGGGRRSSTRLGERRGGSQQPQVSSQVAGRRGRGCRRRASPPAMHSNEQRHARASGKLRVMYCTVCIQPWSIAVSSARLRVIRSSRASRCMLLSSLCRATRSKVSE